MKQCSLCAGGTWSLRLSLEHAQMLRDTSERPVKAGDRGEKSFRDAEESGVITLTGV